MHSRLRVVLLLVAVPLFARAETPLDAYRALQKAAKAKNVEAMSMLVVPADREALAGLDAADAAKRVPTGALEVKEESDDVVTATAGGRTLVFFEVEEHWLIAGVFAKAPAAMVQVEPSVRVDDGEVVTVAPIRGAGAPTANAISAAKAHELLRAAALKERAETHLYTLDTAMHGLSADGTSSSWVASFLTDQPGEMLSVEYDDGAVSEPFLSVAPPDRPGVPDEASLGYDIKPLYEETMRYADGVVDEITLVTASLYRSAGSGKALWMLDVYGDDDRIGQTVVFDARTMKYSHKTN